MFWTRGAEVANQCNSFNEFWHLAISCSYSKGFKIVRSDSNGVKNRYFCRKNNKNRPAAGALTPKPPFVTHLSCISLFSSGPKLHIFCAKKFLLLFQASSLLAKFWLRFWSHSLPLTDFSSDFKGRIRNEQRKAAGFMPLFSDVNTKFSK